MEAQALRGALGGEKNKSPNNLQGFSMGGLVTQIL